MLEEIIELDYPLNDDLHVVLFKCRWVDPTRGMKVHPHYHLVDVNFKWVYQKDEPFILAQQEVQVYYTEYPSMKRDKIDWMAVCKTKARRVESHWTNVAYQVDEEVPVPEQPLVAAARRQPPARPSTSPTACAHPSRSQSQSRRLPLPKSDRRSPLPKSRSPLPIEPQHHRPAVADLDPTPTFDRQRWDGGAGAGSATASGGFGNGERQMTLATASGGSGFGCGWGERRRWGWG
ncbi:UNVERIFIED_CONTAM: hypothetical protein Scaly_2978700 [Sesamum calycinum]|uniref:DUF4216 domain-containing protein n=1 Tax=Sesamum calycinum TaxID=2727403 RepID=A0AAW2KN22_9LAMI